MLVADPEKLKKFADEISKHHLTPLWDRTVKLEPGSNCVPAHWPYALTRPFLDESTLLIDKKRADRRVLVMENPSLRGSSFIANSLFAGLQIILPGEIAPSHRHTPNALRFVVDGEGAYTSISGEKIDIRPGDFIVTPSWAWHDHGNLGQSPVVWMDGLDTPFTSLFGAHFRENYPNDVYPVTKNANQSVLNFGSGMLPLQYGVDSGSFENLLIYPFERTLAVLNGMFSDSNSVVDPCHGYKMRYANPSNGQYPFRTMAAFMQLLPAGFHGQKYRSTENTVFNVASGECLVRLSNQEVHLKAHDVLVVPSWEQYHFEANEQCILFSFSDRSAQQLLGFWREATGDSGDQ